MKFVAYRIKGTKEVRGGYLKGDRVIDLQRAALLAKEREIISLDTDVTPPVTLEQWLELGAPTLQQWQWVDDAMEVEESHSLSLAEVDLAPPLSRPPSFRDFYAFEEHVKTARARRGLDMVPEWYDFPVFYFSNTGSIHGPEDNIQRPRYTRWMDFELEIACVIGKAGRNIRAEEAEDYIAGYLVLNDWSARDVQREEVKVGLGPAKGKDFATSIGPYLVTPDELADRLVGDRYDLRMTAKVNGRLVSEGNFKDIHYSFGQMIERASADCRLYPGDLIGSGTVGTGCILELGPERIPWLEPGDVVELEIERLGVLRNRIV
jgi:fumarylacetoacetate (FAA) hydrolase